MVIYRDYLVALRRHIGELQAEIREAHLEAHPAQLTILAPSQVAKYQQLRGYSGADMHQHDHQHLPVVSSPSAQPTIWFSGFTC